MQNVQPQTNEKIGMREKIGYASGDLASNF